jgi:hypothetical protein
MEGVAEINETIKNGWAGGAGWSGVVSGMMVCGWDRGEKVRWCSAGMCGEEVRKRKGVVCAWRTHAHALVLFVYYQ